MSNIYVPPGSTPAIAAERNYRRIESTRQLAAYDHKLTERQTQIPGLLFQALRILRRQDQQYGNRLARLAPLFLRRRGLEILVFPRPRKNPDRDGFDLALAQSLGVRSIPMLLFFKDGALRDQVVGTVSKSTLVARLEALAA